MSSIEVLAHATAQLSSGWDARTGHPDLATRISVTGWHFTLSSDVPWLGVIFLEDGDLWRWSKAGAETAAAVQTVRLDLHTYSRLGSDDRRIHLSLGGYSRWSAGLGMTIQGAVAEPASRPLVEPHVKTGESVRFGTKVDLATVNVAERLRASVMLVAASDTEARWRGQWRVRPEIPGDFASPFACLREWRLSREGARRF